MAKGWMSKDPSEMTARQQRRMQFMEKRGRGGRVAGQPTEMPQQTERQARRQRFLERKQARQEQAVQDWRQSPQGLMDRFTRNLPSSYEDWATQQYDPLTDEPQIGYQPYEQMKPIDFTPNLGQLPPGYFRGNNPLDPNLYTQTPDGRTIGTYMGYPGMGMPMGGVAMPPRPDAQGVGNAVGGFAGQQMTQNPMDANPFAQSRNKRATPYGPVGSAPFRMRR